MRILVGHQITSVKSTFCWTFAIKHAGVHFSIYTRYFGSVGLHSVPEGTRAVSGKFLMRCTGAGYCDIFFKCRLVDADGPLSRLKKAIFNPALYSTIKNWIVVSNRSQIGILRLLFKIVKPWTICFVEVHRWRAIRLRQNVTATVGQQHNSQVRCCIMDTEKALCSKAKRPEYYFCPFLDAISSSTSQRRKRRIIEGYFIAKWNLCETPKRPQLGTKRINFVVVVAGVLVGCFVDVSCCDPGHGGLHQTVQCTHTEQQP